MRPIGAAVLRSWFRDLALLTTLSDIGELICGLELALCTHDDVVRTGGFPCVEMLSDEVRVGK